jgi:hypothetical protein
MFGVRNGLVALMKKIMEPEQVDTSQLIESRYIIHHEHLCTKVLGFEHLIIAVV